MFRKLVIIFLHLNLVFCYTKPEKSCQIKDEVCITKAIADVFTMAVNADPSAGFEAIDPMHHDRIIESLPSLKITLKNCTVVGWKGINVRSARVIDHNTYINLTVPRIELSGNFEADGHFLSLPLKGKGHFDIKGTDLIVNLKGMKHYYMKNDVLYVTFKDFDFTSELTGKLDIVEGNLFKGNKELADSATEILKSGYTLLNRPITKASFNKIFTNINKLLVDIPVNDLILEQPKVY